MKGLAGWPIEWMVDCLNDYQPWRVVVIVMIALSLRVKAFRRPCVPVYDAGRGALVWYGEVRGCGSLKVVWEGAYEFA